jgi:hypothetical protein
MQALIGSNGTIGQSLLDNMHFDAVFNSDNLSQIAGQEFDLVVCAAPSGNRLAINRAQTQDFQDCVVIARALAQCSIKQLVLISSVDAETAPGSLYGRNRAWLENELSKAHPTHVLRLSTLVGTRIKKNVLFDLKHGLFLDSIDRSAELQWCILNDLPHQIDISLASAPGSRNIVSEPIKNVDIINCFFAHITTGKDSGAVRYNQQPYVYTQAQIFSAMEQYLK